LIRWDEHIGLEDEIRSRSAVWRATSICRAKQQIVESEAGVHILGSRWISGGLRIESIGVRVARINSIICLVTFAGRRHRCNFGFGTGASAFLPRVANRAQNQSGENDDNANDNDQLDNSEIDNSESIVVALVPSAEPIGQAFGTNASTTFVIRHSSFVIPLYASRLLLQAGNDAYEWRE